MSKLNLASESGLTWKTIRRYAKSDLLERGDDNDQPIYMHRANCPGFTATAVDQLLAEVNRLRAIVAKLPLTADGAPIVPGMKVYFNSAILDQGEYGVLVDSVGLECVSVRTGGGECFMGFNSAYSTREAAEKARDAK